MDLPSQSPWNHPHTPPPLSSGHVYGTSAHNYTLWITTTTCLTLLPASTPPGSPIASGFLVLYPTGTQPCSKVLFSDNSSPLIPAATTPPHSWWPHYSNVQSGCIWATPYSGYALTSTAPESHMHASYYDFCISYAPGRPHACQISDTRGEGYTRPRSTHHSCKCLN
jgi:hypothetical protein